MKKIAVLGSTGSIGKSTLRVIQHLKEELSVVALAAHSNVALLEEQIRLFHPKVVCVFDEKKAEELRKKTSCRVLSGMEGLIELVQLPEVDMCVSAMVGASGLIPTIEAIKAKKEIAIANKEVLVCAGELVMQLAVQHGVQLLPIDSEHGALFQCLHGEDPKSIRRLILTASGGPFREVPMDQLESVTVEQALKHPTWNMGAKITIDSSTLMNKGLEVIEARWLFGVPVEQIDVVFHPQSIIHSLCEFVDGSILAQMNQPHMINPIQYALTFPKRRPSLLPYFDFSKAHQLTFAPPDFKKFTCLRLAFEALRIGGTMACYMNAANEILVNRFLNKEISWYSIARKLEQLMERHTPERELSLEKVLFVDEMARKEAAHS